MKGRMCFCIVNCRTRAGKNFCEERKEARRSGPHFQDERRELTKPGDRDEATFLQQKGGHRFVESFFRSRPWTRACKPQANGKLLEDMLNEGASLSNGVEIAVFTVGINHTICVHHGRVHAPLKAIGMVGNASNGSVRIARATLGVGVLWKFHSMLRLGFSCETKYCSGPLRNEALGLGRIRAPVGI